MITTRQNSKNARNAIFRHEIRKTIEEIQSNSERIKEEAQANKDHTYKVEASTSNARTKWGLVAGIIAEGIIAILVLILIYVLASSLLSF